MGKRGAQYIYSTSRHVVYDEPGLALAVEQHMDMDTGHWEA